MVDVTSDSEHVKSFEPPCLHMCVSSAEVLRFGRADHGTTTAVLRRHAVWASRADVHNQYQDLGMSLCLPLPMQRTKLTLATDPLTMMPDAALLILGLDPRSSLTAAENIGREQSRLRCRIEEVGWRNYSTCHVRSTEVIGR